MDGNIAQGGMVQIPSAFDYGSLEANIAKEARAAAIRIRDRIRASILDTGRDLIVIKNRLGHGNFGKWIEAEFGMTARSAQNYMSAAEAFGDKYEIISHLPNTLIFGLASPATPPAFRHEIIAGFQTGQKLHSKDIKARLQTARSQFRNDRVETEKKRWEAQAEVKRGTGFRRPEPVEVIVGDCRAVLDKLPAGFAQCCVTSPPYFGLRDYGVVGQIGLEPSPAEFVEAIVEVFRAVWRVLRDDGTLWLNLGDSYGMSSKGPGSVGSKQRRNAGSLIKPPMAGKYKNLLGIPWLVAFALQADGWYLRSDIIWHKPNPMPESVTDRPTSAHEHIFLLAKNERYYYDAEAIREQVAESQIGRIGAGSFSVPQRVTAGGTMLPNGARIRHGLGESTLGADVSSRNKRDVWTVATQPFSEAHFATFPPALIEPCILAGCPTGGMVMDPFGGAGTTGLVANRLGRRATLIELNPDYAAMARRRLEADTGVFAQLQSEAIA